MKILPLILAAAIASISQGQTVTTAAKTYAQAEVCLDSPGPAAGTTFTATSCAKVGCGPSLTTSITRTSAAGSSAQTWEPWNSIAPTGMVVACVNNSVTTSWVTQSQITASPASPPVTLPTVSQPFTWVAPTVNIDGIAITSAITYNIYQGTSASALVKSQSGLTGLIAILSGLTVGSPLCVGVTAVVANVESTQTVLCETVPAMILPAPNPPTSAAFGPSTTAIALTH